MYAVTLELPYLHAKAGQPPCVTSFSGIQPWQRPLLPHPGPPTHCLRHEHCVCHWRCQDSSECIACARLLARDTVVGIDNLNAYYDPALKEARLARLLPHPNFRF